MDLNNIRREYLKDGLNRDHLNANPFEQFQTWMQQAMDAKITADPTAMSLATVSPEGQPSQRTVLLKHFDEKGFVFYTNLDSRKAQEIGSNPKVCLMFAWLPIERQVIIYGKAGKLSIADATRYFLTRPRESQIAAWTSHQSRLVESRKVLDLTFAKMKAKFAQGDIPLPTFWGGYRVVPEKIEFWQGGQNRLHDRFMYTQQDDASWSIERLQP